MKKLLLLLVLTTSGFVFKKLCAQIVNIEDRRATLDSTGVYWQGDFGGKLTQNTSSVLSLSAAVRMDALGEKRHWLLLGNYNLVQSGDNRVINEAYGHLRYGQPISEDWTWEAFGQLQFNNRLFITQRALAGTGPRYQLQDRDAFDIALGLLYMYEYNELEQSETPVYRRDHRLSAYISMRWQLAEHASLASTSYYQPLLDNFGESRLSTVNSLNVSLGRNLSFSTALSLTYDDLLARIVGEIPSTSYQWQNFLRLNF